MPTQKLPPIDNFVEKLKQELAGFEDIVYPPLSQQLNAFASIHEAFKRLGESESHSRQRENETTRLRDLMTDIFLHLGPEVFTLCAFAIPRTALSRISSRDFLPRLKEWWGGAPRPRGLTATAHDLCQDVGRIIREHRQRMFHGIGTRGEFIALCIPLLAEFE